MAIDSRANNTILINNNLPDNITELITPALHRDVEYNLNDSNFNKIDEPRDIIEASAFVSNNGDDLTGKFGDMSSPFATIQAGVDAVPLTGGVVQVMGGTYTEDVVITKNNFYIKANGCAVTGSFWFKDCTDVGGDFTGSEVTSNNSSNTPLRFSGTAGNKKVVRGGKFTQTVAGAALTGNDAFVIGGQFIGQNDAAAISSLSDSNIILCTGLSNGGATLNYGTIFRCSNCAFAFSTFKDTLAGRHAYSTQLFNTFYNCSLESEGTTLRGESFSGLRGVFVNCNIISNASSACELVGSTQDFKIDGGKINGAVHGLDLSGLASGTTRPAGTTNIVKDVIIYAGSGNPIEEPVTYEPLDAGVLLSINNTYNKTQPAPSAKLIESNPFTYVGLEDV